MLKNNEFVSLYIFSKSIYYRISIHVFWMYFWMRIWSNYGWLSPLYYDFDTIDEFCHFIRDVLLILKNNFSSTKYQVICLIIYCIIKLLIKLNTLFAKVNSLKYNAIRSLQQSLNMSRPNRRSSIDLRYSRTHPPISYIETSVYAKKVIDIY